MNYIVLKSRFIMLNLENMNQQKKGTAFLETYFLQKITFNFGILVVRSSFLFMLL